MKKILMSLLTVAVVAGAGLAATSAFFSDTETSAGNVFQVGAVDLKIDSTAHYNGMECVTGDEGQTWTWQPEAGNNTPAELQYPVAGTECTGSWAWTDLDQEKFFNFADVKPGDWGENTISLHVYNNPAHACMYIEDMVDLDNSLTEPESELDLVDDGVGELSSELRFFAWDDKDGDNVWESGEEALFSNVEGPASDVLDGVVYPLGVLPGVDNESDPSAYLGVYWCYGAMTVDEGTHTLSCNGSGVSNMTQTDSLTANVRFYVEQERHNGDFVCPAIEKKVFEKTYDSGRNDTNKTTLYNGYYLPNVDYAIDGQCIDLTFNNPTPFYFAFDYQIDGESGTNGPWWDVVIHEGELNGQQIGPEYNLVSVPGGSSQNVQVCGEDEILVGLRQGAEQNWYFDWIKFEAM